MTQSPPLLTRITLEDPAGDDHGPGSYRYPIDHRLPPGSFDLTRVELKEEGDQLELSACFRARPVLFEGVWVGENESRDLLPQAVDVYLDTDGQPGSGMTRTLPGRRVTVSPDFAWEKVLALLPREDLFPGWLGQADPELAGRTLVTSRIRQRGRCLSARFSRKEIGPLVPGLGVVVLVSGARFVPSYGMGDRLLGKAEPAAFIRDVLPIPESCVLSDRATFDCAFGGCQPCGQHPLVLDALLCGSQEAALSSFEVRGPKLAVVQGVRIGPDGRGSCPVPAQVAEVVVEAGPGGGGPELPGPSTGQECGDFHIAARDGALLSIVGGEARKTGELGRVLGPGGEELGKLVVTGQAGPVTLGQSLAPEAAFAPGMTVRFSGAERCEPGQTPVRPAP